MYEPFVRSIIHKRGPHAGTPVLFVGGPWISLQCKCSGIFFSGSLLSRRTSLSDELPAVQLSAAGGHVLPNRFGGTAASTILGTTGYAGPILLRTVARTHRLARRPTIATTAAHQPRTCAAWITPHYSVKVSEMTAVPIACSTCS